MRRWFLAGLLIAAALCVLPLPASAHGVLEGASPPPNASLASAPDALVLVFSEAADPAFTSASVVDQDGRTVSGPSRLSADGRRLRAVLQTLPRGIYTVRWRVLSAVDGHTTTGFYAFAVGMAAPAGAATGEISPPPVQVIVRWISYASALLLAGAAFFSYFIARPVLAVSEPHLAVSLEEAAAVGVRRLSVPAALALIVSLGAAFVLQAQALFETSLPRLFAAGQLQAMLSGTRLGWSALLQAAMAAVLLIPATRRGRVFRMAAVLWATVAGGIALIVSTPGGVTASQHFLHFAALLLIGTVYGLISVMAAIILPLVPDLRLPQAAWASPAAGAILLVGMTLTAHAGGAGYVAMGADWLHLAAAAMWIGGLVGMIATLRAAPPALRPGVAQALLPRFSRFAGGSLLVLVITGTYAAWLNIPAWSGFLITRYGLTLLIKLGLVLPWIALGAFNHFVMRPRLARAPDRPHLKRFVRLVGGEVALAGAVLLAVAALTITPPARVTMPAPAGAGIVLAGFADDLRVQLTVRPMRTGWNTYAVGLDRRGTAVRLDGRVQLRFVKLDEDTAPATTVLRPDKIAGYRGEGADLGQSGWWRVDVIVRVRGQPDRIVEFPLFFDGSAETAGDDGSSILAGALQRAHAVSSWRDIQQITDGRGGVVRTRFDFSAPDRVRYATSSGTEAIIIGTQRYTRDGGPWREDALPTPVVLGGPYVEYLRDAQRPIVGRGDTCGAEPCRVVFWLNASGTARFAGWVGERSRLVYRLLMVALQHYMTATAFDFDAPLAITPPK